MSTLRQAAEEYLAMRRALGFKLDTQGRHLMSFIEFCQARGARHVTTELALAWATQTSRGSSDEVYQSRRLMVVRIFARHLAALDPATEVPPEDILPHHYRRIAPYLYSPGEITALMAAAGRLAPPLRAATWQTLIGLLAVTGMRQSQARYLDRDQVDLDAGVLTITDAKSGKSRQLFLHPTAVAALRGYQRRRDRWCPAPADPSFFISTRGTRLNTHTITHAFAALPDDAGIAAPPGRRRPRLHDLRHSFTVASQVSNIALGASFNGLREHALPAAQRAALRRSRHDGARAQRR
ncbi:MAG TPA: tyrosine-type recombinase/integrase [Streptosporangiaceae bacterium]